MVKVPVEVPSCSSLAYSSSCMKTHGKVKRNATETVVDYTRFDLRCNYLNIGGKQYKPPTGAYRHDQLQYKDIYITQLEQD